jgi:peptidyl-dipeptidase Dcp
MKSLILIAACFFLFSFVVAQDDKRETDEANPFFQPWHTPFETPPFELIKIGHYKPAFEKGMEEQKREIEAITTNSEAPTFRNTIEALERSGALLEKVDNVFSAMRGANTSDELDKIDNEVTPALTKHRSDISLNEKLFQRVKAVYNQRKKLKLNTEEAKLLDETYKGFVRNGADLSPEKKKRLREINEELSMLSLKFNQNLLKETNSFKLVVERQEDLAGLPQRSIDAAAELAKNSGQEGKWVFTVQKPSMIPFLQYARNRELREKIFKAYINRGDNNNEFDNKEILSKTAALRVERGSLLGYKTYADYVLEENMAKTPEAVYEFLHKLWKPALKVAERERDDMQEMIKQEGGTFKLEPWDWWYYAEKVRKGKYDLDEDELRPYFVMENVRKGAFEVASRLYGIEFVERNDIPKYLDEVQVFEVKRSDGSHVGIFYTDYYPRSGKRPGAWMSNFRNQKKEDGEFIAPVVYNVGNFSRPTGDKPSFMNLDEVETLFHEFGHALHGLLSNCTYSSLSGASVPRDFVELPSQIMENWAFEPEVLRTYARHYQTGETIPQTLIDKIKNSSKFNQGFVTVEYLAAAFLDMDWHTLTTTKTMDANSFEQKSLAKIQLIPEIVSRYRSPYFAHIFGGGYFAGYYSYIWAEVLDSDAFAVFKEKGLFDQATAKSFRENILEKGGTDDPMKLYVKFRGRKPTIEPLLKKRGLL